MDTVFSLPEAVRADFLRTVAQSCGCAYICVWSYDSRFPNRLLFLDGLYNQPSSSLVNAVAQSLFNEQRGLQFDVTGNHVPGLAFRNNRVFQFGQGDLLTLAWTDIQKRFYQEARIETAVFMGCNTGEIELGFSTMSQDYIQTALRNIFPADDLSRSQPQLIDQNPPSSSSSSLRSLSNSPEYSSLLFNIPGAAHYPETLGGVPTMQPARPVSTSTANSPHQAAIRALAQASQIQLPTPENENDAIMRAILHVISSDAPSSSTSHHQTHLNLPYPSVVHPECSAFKRYSPDLSRNITLQRAPNLLRQSLFKRSLAFYRNLNNARMRELSFQTNRPTTTQLHHMISERRRREKLNENFQALRALLPPGTKKDKASILTAAKETLSSLRAEIEKLSKRNMQLESVLPANETNAEATKTSTFSGERLSVQVLHVPESSSSQERIIDLQVLVRGQNSQADILIRLLEFIKQDQNVSMISIDANTHMAEGIALNQVHFRLKVEGSDWDESAFQEAGRRVVADLAQ
ncbi:hypothetical protein L6164_013948 [Bauhinia variegata]|uniref:Uncharacterized protein n=1 Tax=Bauhinia variegata TaxID=167791 RepID=A0ACB9NGJ0_BAUVA|nr:hypothetical protein L6164_013948 [Bauhinia variegata]